MIHAEKHLNITDERTATLSDTKTYEAWESLGSYRIAIIDDDEDLTELLQSYYRNGNHHAETFSSAGTALQAMAKQTFHLVLCDLKLPDSDGIKVLQRIRQFQNPPPVVMITAFASIDTAVSALQSGAADYVKKPIHMDELGMISDRVIRLHRLEIENRRLKREIDQRERFDGLIGKSPKMKMVFELIERISSSSAPVLITGESGTGKEVVARSIHKRSSRSDHSFVAVNCSAIPETLLESELFGYRRGAFTGANETRKGLFDEASGGTLFLDEIGDMPVSLQAKLLRVLQDGQVKPLGDPQGHEVDVRIIAATHRNLKERVQSHDFREDLYYRLCVIPIHVPALRERMEDLPLLVRHFLQKYSEKSGRKVVGISKMGMEKLLQHSWNGNIRELENTMERAIVLTDGPTIEVDDLHLDETAEKFSIFGKTKTECISLKELERRYISYVLEKTEGKKDRAAEVLGIDRKTLYRKIKR